MRRAEARLDSMVVGVPSRTSPLHSVSSRSPLARPLDELGGWIVSSHGPVVDDGVTGSGWIVPIRARDERQAPSRDHLAA